MVDRIRKVVENECYLGPITLFLGAKTAFFGRGERAHYVRGRDARDGRSGETKRSIGHPSTRPVDELRSSRSGQVEHGTRVQFAFWI